MLNLILIDKKPLENPEDQLYSQMAFDGTHFYCCVRKLCKVYKLNCDGKFVCCIDTKRAYYSICFDCAEKCFWAISCNCRNLIFKLNDCLSEIGSIDFPCHSCLYKNISYSFLNDMLLLCSENTVAKVSKSGVKLPYYRGVRSTQFDATVQVFDKLLINCNFNSSCPNIVGVLYPNFCFDYVTCMPKGFSLDSLCVGYGCGSSATLFVLARQNYKFSYLIKYRVENCVDEKECCSFHPSELLDNSQMVNIYVDCMDVQTNIII